VRFVDPMSAYNYRPAIERLKYVATLLRTGKPFTARTVAERFEMERRTVVRDLEFLRDRLGWDFDFDWAANTYKLRAAPEPML
jgi:hypothetical protein